MSADPTRIGAPGGNWWLDPGLARLAFGSQPGRRDTGASTMHLAFLPVDALELDLTDPAQRDFGDYELRERVGQGGMGVVYRAWQQSLEREVAIKLLSAGPWASDEFVAGFRREARNAASLQHPNIVAVHEMGEQDGLVYYAMQLVRGSSLAAVVEARGRLPAREAAALIRTVAEAVDYAHRLGVLHLDLKPANILIDEHGTALVTDFGLARRLGQAPSLENEQISGTPSYMAPEQAQVRSTRLSAATDIWGIGAILYECLTGAPPFSGASPQATLERVLTGTVRRPTRDADVPPDLEAICLRCLARPQEARYATARDLADDLGRFLEHRAVQARPLGLLQQTGRWVRREPALATAIGAATLALVIGLASTAQQWMRAETNAFTASTRLWDGRREAALLSTADGAGWDAVDRLLLNIAEQDAAGLEVAAQADRRRLGMLLGQGAVLLDTTSIADATPLAVAVSDDGARVALAFGDRSVRWYDAATLAELGRADLGERRSSGGQLRSTTWLRFAGADTLLATQEWYRNQPGPTGGDTWRVDLAAATVREPPAAFADFSDAAWSDDGRVALLRGGDGHVQAWRADPWRPLSPRLPPPAAGGDALPWRLSGDGRLAMTLVDAQRTLQVYATDGMRLLHRVSPDARSRLTAWAADPAGRRVAFGDEEGRLYLLDLEAAAEPRLLPSSRGRRATWLAFDEAGAWLAAGAEDGRVHAFEAASGDPLFSGSMEHEFAVRRVALDHAQRLLLVAGDGRSALWRLASIGSAGALPPTRIALPPAPHAAAGPLASDWSPRSGLFASAGHDGQLRLWRLPAGAMAPLSAPSQVPDQPAWGGGRSVDVEWDRLRVVEADGRALTPWHPLPQPPGYAELTADGATLLLTLGPALHRLDAATLRPRGTPLPLPASPQRFVLAPGGHRLLLGFAAPHDAGFGERLQAWNLDDWTPEPGEARLHGPLQQLSIAADGRRVVAVGAGAGETQVLTLPGLQPIGTWPHDFAAPVVGADFVPGEDRRVWLLTRGDEGRLADDAALRWDPASDAVDRRVSLAAAQPYAVLALADGGVFVAGERRHVVVGGDGDARSVAREIDPDDAAMGAVAINAGRSLIAVAARQRVQLHAADGTPVGAPLRLGGRPHDGIFDLVFAPDDSMLVARTVHGAARWPIAPPSIDDAALALQRTWLTADTRMPRELHLPSPAQRAALRAQDPGAWRDAAPRPAIPAAGTARLDGVAIPARAAATPDTALDLTRVYDLAPDSVQSSSAGTKPFLRPWAAGLQRFAGTRFDHRGIVVVGADGTGESLPVPVPAIAAVQPFLLSALRTPEDGPRRLAELEFHYVDGGMATVPLRATVELPGYGENDQDVPFAYVARAPRAATGFRQAAAAAPRLANPEPGRAVRCVDLRSPAGTTQLFAMSVIPAPAPVIAGGNFRNSQ